MVNSLICREIWFLRFKFLGISNGEVRWRTSSNLPLTVLWRTIRKPWSEGYVHLSELSKLKNLFYHSCFWHGKRLAPAQIPSFTKLLYSQQPRFKFVLDIGSQIFLAPPIFIPQYPWTSSHPTAQTGQTDTSLRLSDHFLGLAVITVMSPVRIMSEFRRNPKFKRFHRTVWQTFACEPNDLCLNMLRCPFRGKMQILRGKMISQPPSQSGNSQSEL